MEKDAEEEEEVECAPPITTICLIKKSEKVREPSVSIVAIDINSVGLPVSNAR